ncbi:MAG: hypothetical protein R3E02_11870 [Blastomonas sp.]
MRLPLAIAMAGALAVAACATPEMRVRSALVDAGLKKEVAGCMAGRMVDRLSIGQLQKLGRLGKLGKDDPGDISLNAFLDKTRALRDPEILGVVSSSGLICWARD